MTGRNKDVLEKLATDISGFFEVGDLTEEGGCERIVSGALKQLGQITTLVNCAGVLKVRGFVGSGCRTDASLWAPFSAGWRHGLCGVRSQELHVQL